MPTARYTVDKALRLRHPLIHYMYSYTVTLQFRSQPVPASCAPVLIIFMFPRCYEVSTDQWILETFLRASQSIGRRFDLELVGIATLYYVHSVLCAVLNGVKTFSRGLIKIDKD